MGEAEEEFSYQDELNRSRRPRVLVPLDSMSLSLSNKLGDQPAFLAEFVISQQKLAPVRIKIDSIIIKGSKILSRHPKSAYIDGSLFNMAKAYFYRSEWLPCEIKCKELAEQIPYSDFAPDNHLLMSKSFLMQKKMDQGKRALSQTVDIAWFKKRYDVLSEAFRIQAELSIVEGDFEAALKPYRQAVAQADDGDQKSRWLVDLGALLFRMGRFEEAAVTFRQAKDQGGELVTAFEADVYLAGSLIRAGKPDQATILLEGLEENSNYTEWKGWVHAQKLAQLQKQKLEEEYKKEELFSDTAFVGNPSVVTASYERAKEFYANGDYVKARTYFARGKVIRTPAYDASNTYYNLLNSWQSSFSILQPFLANIHNLDSIPKEKRSLLAEEAFKLARTHLQLFHVDSSFYYYQMSAQISPVEDTTRAKYLYGWAFLLTDQALKQNDQLEKERMALLSDSLMEVIIDTYPGTEYAADARNRLGFTANALVNLPREYYFSGLQLRKTKQYDFAARQFIRVVDSFPQSPFYHRALYALGWMSERDIPNLDTAIFWYKRLVIEKQNTDEARDVSLALAFAIGTRDGKPVPDSLLDLLRSRSGTKRSEKGDPVYSDSAMAPISMPQGTPLDLSKPNEFPALSPQEFRELMKTRKPGEQMPNFPGMNGFPGGMKPPVLRGNQIDPAPPDSVSKLKPK